MKNSYHTILLLLVIVLMFLPQLTTAQTMNHPLLSHGLSEGADEQLIEKGTGLEEALSILEKKFGVLFLYRSQLLEQKMIPDVEVIYQGRELSDILQSLLNGSDLTYSQISHRTIGIAPNDAEEILDVYQETVTGTVVDAETGESLPGVNIIVKGTSTGTITDVNGLYELTLPTESDTLIFSYIGYEALEVPVDSRERIDVELESRAIMGEDLIVVGYGTMQREDLTGSVSQISSVEMTRASVGNTAELLSGRVPGLTTVSRTGLPGESGTQFQIRGFGNPLVLVDGMERSLDFIDPNDIESISVLKDASAAIYGARAGNGVILVTTKRGETGRPSFNMRSNLSFQQPTQLINTVNAAQWVEMYREGDINSGTDPRFSQEDIERYRSGEPGFESYNWWDTTFKPWAPMQDYNLSVSGGNEDYTYFISTGHMNQDSAFRSGDYTFQRYGVRASFDANVAENMTFSLNLSTRAERRKRAAESLNEVFNALNRAQPIWNPNIPDGRPAYSGFGNQSPRAASTADYSGTLTQDSEYVDGILAFEYRVPWLTGLELEARLSYNYTSDRIKNHLREFEVYSYDPEQDEYQLRGARGGNSLTNTDHRNHSLNPRIMANYQGIIRDHNFSALLLAEWIDEQNSSFNAFRRDLISPEIPFLFAGGVDGIDNMESFSEAGRASYVGRFQYGYQSRYRIEATMRADASYKFPEDTRWGYFPSISASWSLNNEPFFNIDAVDELRFRFSYSQSGDDSGVAAYRYLSGFFIRTAQNYIANQRVWTLISEDVLPNPDITWLDMTIYNAGVNLSLYDGLFSTEFNLFQRTTDNIFGTSQETFPSTFGASLPQLNINETRDRGFDLLVGHENIIGDFGYSISANVTYSREKYIRWSESDFEDEDEARLFQNQGNYTNRWIGYKSDGIFMTQEEIDNHDVDQDGAGNATLRPGDIRYLDLNGDGELTWRDQTEIGRGMFPDLSFGINIDVNYRNFDLSALFQGASMFNFNIGGRARGAFDNDGTPHVYQYKYRWQPDPNNPSVNVNPDARLPRVELFGVGTNENNNRQSDFWLVDATYLRLKNLSLSYTVPTTITNPVGISNLRLIASGSNLLTWTRMGVFEDSFDPEIPGNTNTGNYPNVRVISFGVNLNF
ncbi:MAG: TonB-dependent receptor [Balneolaceae bacterium]|nr:TonB-dependent receptor [Balneolaceae bacterium]